MNYFKPASTLEQLPRRQKFSNHFWNFSCIFSINHFLVNTVKTSITKLAKRCDELIFPNKLHLCLYWYMNNTCSSIGLRYTLRMEGCDIFWVTPLSAFEHAPSYDLFSFPMNFLLIFFFKGDSWRIKSMRWNKHVFRWKQKLNYWLWYLNEKNSYVARMRTRIRLVSRANVMRSTRCAVWYEGNHPERLWRANDHLE